MRETLRSLGWYCAWSAVLFPLIAAPFSGGASLMLWFLPFGRLANKNYTLVDSWHAILMLVGPGVILWIITRFFKFAVRSKRNRMLGQVDDF